MFEKRTRKANRASVVVPSSEMLLIVPKHIRHMYVAMFHESVTDLERKISRQDIPHHKETPFFRKRKRTRRLVILFYSSQLHRHFHTIPPPPKQAISELFVKETFIWQS